MGIDRARIEEAHRNIQRATEQADWSAWADLFSEDTTFVNSMLEEPLRGREALRSFAAHWPSTLINAPEWTTIDGNQLAVGWNERQHPDAAAYRGISTFVFDDDGLVESYEGMFNTAKVVAAIEAGPPG